MHDKPLDQAEQDLLEVILTLHAEKGPLLRDRLSVVGRGRGLEVARPLARLKTLRLVEEVERRPFFLLRLFGARTTVVVRPTAMALARATKPVPADPAPVATADLPPASPVDPLPPAVESPAAAVAPTEAVPQVAPQPEPAPQEQPEAFAAPVHDAAAYEVLPEPAPEPVADLAPQPVEPEPLPELVVAPPPPVAPQPRPVRFAPDAYTDEMGGQPMATMPMPTAIDLDPELLDGLREMLTVLGMEMTIAGEALVNDRMGRGASAGEALSQVVLFAFAHAVHYDILAGNPVDPQSLREYTIGVIREIEKLRDAGEIAPEPFERDMRAIWALADKETDRGPQVADLLSDPIGGSAPPALLPEELRGIVEEDEEE